MSVNFYSVPLNWDYNINDDADYSDSDSDSEDDNQVPTRVVDVPVPVLDSTQVADVPVSVPNPNPNPTPVADVPTQTVTTVPAVQTFQGNQPQRLHGSYHEMSHVYSSYDPDMKTRVCMFYMYKSRLDDLGDISDIPIPLDSSDIEMLFGYKDDTFPEDVVNENAKIKGILENVGKAGRNVVVLCR